MVSVLGQDIPEDYKLWSALVHSNSAITNFVNNAAILLNRHQLDGLDVDWEYPKTSKDKAGFTELMRALHKKFSSTPGRILSAAFGADPNSIDDCNIFLAKLDCNPR